MANEAIQGLRSQILANANAVFQSFLSYGATENDELDILVFRQVDTLLIEGAVTESQPTYKAIVVCGPQALIKGDPESSVPKSLEALMEKLATKAAVTHHTRALLEAEV